MSTDWIPGAGVGVGGSILAWLLSWRVATAKAEGRNDSERERIDQNASGLRQDIRELREDLKSGIAEFRTVAEATTKLQASQNVVNNVTGKALEGVGDKLDRHDAELADHAATLKLITELVTRKGIPGPTCPFEGTIAPVKRK